MASSCGTPEDTRPGGGSKDWVWESVGTWPPSYQDNRLLRGSLNLTYRPSPKFDTGLTAGVEENEIVALARTASINNTRQRTYSVAWNWTGRPGSSWYVTQYNSATAAQQYYTFSPDRDQPSFIYHPPTPISNPLSPPAPGGLGGRIQSDNGPPEGNAG